MRGARNWDFDVRGPCLVSGSTTSVDNFSNPTIDLVANRVEQALYLRVTKMDQLATFQMQATVACNGHRSVVTQNGCMGLILIAHKLAIRLLWYSVCPYHSFQEPVQNSQKFQTGGRGSSWVMHTFIFCTQPVLVIEDTTSSST